MSQVFGNKLFQNKEKRIGLFLILSLFTSTLCVGAFDYSGKEDSKVQAADYYASADTSSRTNLINSLYTIIGKNTVDVGYGGLWEAYATTDCKPGTNIIWDMYSNEEYECGGSKQGKTYSKEGDSYNREHTVPQSWFKEASPMKADLFHVYPTDGYVNNRRNNYFHANVATATYTSNNGSKLGTSADEGISGTVFEPIDEYKGDFARSYFYMATRYKDKVGSWTGDLFSSSFPYIQSRFIEVYYQWHLNDPVSLKETTRNDAVYSIQKNRNPYIDHPEWVGYIFKGIETKELTSLSYTGSPSKTTYTAGEKFDATGLTITAHYSDETTEDVTSKVSWSPSPLTVGTTSVTGTYGTKSISINGIVVNEPIVETTDLVITKSNSELGTTSVSKEVAYTIPNYSDESFKIQWNNCNNNASYDEITIAKTNGKFYGTSDIYVNKLTVDFYKAGDYVTVYADGKAVTGINTGSSSKTSSQIMEYTINSTNWSFECITIGTTSYNKNLYSITFTVDLTKTKAIAWSKDFASNLTCDQGVTAPSTSVWNNYQTSYLKLDNNVQTIIKTAEYDISGSGAATVVTALNSTNQFVAEAVAKYDYVINKYGASSYTNFINRKINSSANNFKIAANQSFISIITVLASISLVGVLFVLCFRKQKQIH